MTDPIEIDRDDGSRLALSRAESERREAVRRAIEDGWPDKEIAKLFFGSGAFGKGRRDG